MLLRSYIDPSENREASRKLPRLMVEGLFLGGSGLGVFALIFEIVADAFSVAAYQTLLAIHGASGYHDIAILAFILLSVMLFLGIVPAYKAGAEVQKAMISLLFPLTDDELIFEQFQQYKWEKQPEAIWQFCRERYSWAKNQWPNLSGRLTTVWTLQEVGLNPDEVDIKTVISINARNDLREIRIHTHGRPTQDPATEKPASPAECSQE